MASTVNFHFLFPVCLVVLLKTDVWTVYAKPAAAGPCIDCIQDGQPAHDHAAPQDDVIDQGVAKTDDVEELTHAGDHVHEVVQNDAQVDVAEREEHIEQSQEQFQEHLPRESQNADINVDHMQQESIDDGGNNVASDSVASRDVEGVAEETGAEQDDVPGNHPKDVRSINGNGQEGGQYQAGNVEEIFHGEEGVHDSSSMQNGPEADDNKEEHQAGNVEQLMHGEEGVHDHQQPAVLERNPPQEFKSGDVEEMVHGEAHVHDGLPKGADSGPFKAGDVEELIHGTDSHNVHDPNSRHQARKEVASAGDVDKLMRGDDAHSDDVDEHRGKIPTVQDGEHLLHGAGGHDHDVKQLKFVKTKEEKAAKDPFSNLHHILMHAGSEEEDGEHSDDKIRRGKKVTYKDIMDLGLDEEVLKGIDLTQLLLQDAEEYDDWQRDRLTFHGEIPEGSFWEQIGELRKRYLSFGSNDGKARDLTGARLDPEKQQWVTESDENEAGKVSDEDDVLHQLELLGNTAAVGDRHKHEKKREFTENGRDLTDL